MHLHWESWNLINRYEESLTDLNKSLEIEPNNAVALGMHGETYLMMNKGLLEDLNKSSVIEPNDAFASKARGESIESWVDLNKSLEIKPNDTFALDELE
ncbi:hypothetical protein C2G38_2159879 [Gigaspora rosea]|uniref:Uncharacterized protein n=1 Tax=Gigaspora rosea TaxID=44941 RepID=A0A397W5Z8_9GLOM|nr:hypothetical protein C2G38_2159879 [Gigaspora rosea]